MTATTTNSTLPSLAATPRAEKGKGAVKRLRRTGQIPAIAYGKGLAATSISVAPKDILKILTSPHGKNSVVQLGLQGTKDLLVMIRDYTYHPVTRSLEHVDLVEVKLDRPVDVEIPLLFQGKPAGLAEGGVIRQVYRTIPVRCLPDRIPVKLEIDITHLHMGEHVSTKDLNLGEGVTPRIPLEQTIIAIVAPEKDRTEEEEAAAAAATAAAGAAAGTAAAPAAAGAAAPAAAGAKDAKAPAAAAPAKDAKKK